MDTGLSVGSTLMGPSGDSGNIYLGKMRLHRVWTDNPSGLSITWGLGTAPAPTANSYSIGTVPQDFDTGNNLDTIRFSNNSSISSAHYFIQVLARA